MASRKSIVKLFNDMGLLFNGYVESKNYNADNYKGAAFEDKHKRALEEYSGVVDGMCEQVIDEIADYSRATQKKAYDETMPLQISDDASSSPALLTFEVQRGNFARHLPYLSTKQMADQHKEARFMGDKLKLALFEHEAVLFLENRITNKEFAGGGRRDSELKEAVDLLSDIREEKEKRLKPETKEDLKFLDGLMAVSECTKRIQDEAQKGVFGLVTWLAFLTLTGVSSKYIPQGTVNQNVDQRGIDLAHELLTGEKRRSG